MENRHSLENAELKALYERAGFAGRVGWGDRPALLVIDMAGAWTDPQAQIGADLSGVMGAITRLLDVARSRGDVPIYFTTMAWDRSLSEIGEVVRRKTPHSEKMLVGSEAVMLRPELERRPQEPLITKPRASGFFGTNLLSMLISEKVDTTIVVGCSTSGCIRATCESAFNHGFHAIVPEEATGDRCPSAHEASLFDIDARYADVMPLEDVIGRLKTMPTRA